MRNAMKFREKLQRGHVCFGVGITFYDPTVTDALCPLFDFIWIDMEHNALTVEAVQAPWRRADAASPSFQLPLLAGGRYRPRPITSARPVPASTSSGRGRRCRFRSPPSSVWLGRRLIPSL